MAGDQPSSASPRSQPHRRTSSTISLSKAAAGAGGPRVKAGKAHIRAHNRNRSFGRDLNKLRGLTGIDDASVRPTAMGRTSSNPGQASSSTTNMKRNKSDVALPRTGSKVHIKKNQSAVNLTRNQSHTKLKRNSRPTTPKTRDEDDSRNKHAQPAFTIDTDDDEEDEEEDDWTEESASVSPVVTRSGSMKGQRPNVQVNGARSGTTSPLKQDASAESPTTLVAEHKKLVGQVQPPHELKPSRLPNSDELARRLISQKSFTQPAPKLSTISAGGSSGTQSPAQTETNGHMNGSEEFSRTSSMPSQPSMPSDNVSTFLNPGDASSSGKRNYSSQVLGAMDSIRGYGSRTRSPSPNPQTERGLPKSKSVGHLAAQDVNKLGAAPTSAGALSKGDQLSITIDPSKYRDSRDRLTQKMDMWRSQGNVEPSAAPPAPLLRNGADAQKYMGAEERRVRMAEEAEAELTYLRIYRNPATESIERLQAVRKQKQKARKRASLEENDGRYTNGVPAARNKSKRPEHKQNGSQETPNGTPNGSLGTTIAGSAGTSSRRSVRFSVGADGNDEHDAHEDVTEEARLASMLRSLWYGGEADAASVD